MTNRIQDLGYGDGGAWRLYNTSGVPSSGAHEPTKAEIKAFVDAVANSAGADSILNYGGGPTVSDNKDALDAAIAACVANGTKILRLPSTSGGSVYNFTSEPAKINAPIHILGDGIERTIVYKSYVGSSSTRGLFHWENSPFRLGEMSITAQTGAKTGAAVGMVASGPGVEPGWSNLEGLYISSGPLDGWDYDIYFDGSANTGAAIGIRDIDLRRLYLFGAKQRAAYFKSPYLLHWSSGICVSDTGSGAADGSLEIDGTSSAPGTDINIDIEAITDLRLSNYINSGNIRFALCQRIFNSSNCTGIITNGRVVTSVESNWPVQGANTCRHIDTAVNVGSNATGSWAEVSPGADFYIQLFTVTLTSSFQTFNFPTPFSTVLSCNGTLLGTNGSDSGIIQQTLGNSSVQLACSAARTGTQARMVAFGYIRRGDLP